MSSCPHSISVSFCLSMTDSVPLKDSHCLYVCLPACLPPPPALQPNAPTFLSLRPLNFFHLLILSHLHHLKHQHFLFLPPSLIHSLHSLPPSISHSPFLHFSLFLSHTHTVQSGFFPRCFSCLRLVYLPFFSLLFFSPRLPGTSSLAVTFLALPRPP